MKTETLTPQQKQNAAIEAGVKAFLKKAVRRDGLPFTATAFQRNAQGQLTMIKGEAAITDEKEVSTTTPMYWNIQGTAQSQNRGLDLVTEEKI